MDSFAFIAAALVVGAICGMFGAYISGTKNRNPYEGLALGFMFGPIGLLIAVLMPTQARPELGSDSEYPSVRRKAAPDFSRMTRTEQRDWERQQRKARERAIQAERDEAAEAERWANELPR